MIIGEKIKALRVLASTIGVSPSTIYRYENSEIANMGIDKLMAICAVLDVPAYYLFDRHEYTSPSSKQGTGGNENMATDKKRFSITVDDELYRKIEDFRFERRIKNQSKAVNELMLLGLAALVGNEIKLGPNLSGADKLLLNRYHALDRHGRELVDIILQKEYERCAASQDPSDKNAEEFLRSLKATEDKKAL